MGLDVFPWDFGAAWPCGADVGGAAVAVEASLPVVPDEDVGGEVGLDFLGRAGEADGYVHFFAPSVVGTAYSIQDAWKRVKPSCFR